MSIRIRQRHLKTVFGHLKHICGVHWNRSKPFTKTKGTVKFYQDVYYCKHKSFSPKLDILLLLTNCPKCFDCCFENLVLYQDNILSWWCSNILLLWGEIICSPLLWLPQGTFPKPSPTCFPWKNGFHTITEPKKIHNHIQINFLMFGLLIFAFNAIGNGPERDIFCVHGNLKMQINQLKTVYFQSEIATKL